MGMLDELLNSQNAAVLQQLAKNFGVSENDAKNAVSSVLPALSRGVRNNASAPDGLGSLMNALNKGNHQQYLEHPESLGRQETIADGNAILGHLLGSKDVSRNVATHASGESGLDAGLLKKMLPAIAALAMGSLSKQASSVGVTNRPGSGQNQADIFGQLTSLLDADKDGSVLDDVLGVAGKFFR